MSEPGFTGLLDFREDSNDFRIISNSIIFLCSQLNNEIKLYNMISESFPNKNPVALNPDNHLILVKSRFRQ